MSAAAAADPVLSTLGPTPEVFQFHFDTFELPAHVEVLGRTGATNEAFRVGERAWGVQFHIEIGPAAMHSWLATFAAEVDAVGVDRELVRAETVTRWAAHRRLTTAFGAAFASQVARLTALAPAQPACDQGVSTRACGTSSTTRSRRSWKNATRPCTGTASRSGCRYSQAMSSRTPSASSAER